MNFEDALSDIRDIILKYDRVQVLQKVVDYLYENFDKYSWVGIYIVNNDFLHLGPWKGKQVTEHVKIPIGQGLCGSAAESGKIEVVSDVSNDERYLACFVSTRSEIVVPIFKERAVVGEIDIDSDVLDAFDDNDSVFLEKVSNMISDFC